MVQSGKKHPRPENCKVAVYTTMLSCWRQDPRGRPTFTELASTFLVLRDRHQVNASAVPVDDAAGGHEFPTGHAAADQNPGGQ